MFYENIIIIIIIIIIIVIIIIIIINVKTFKYLGFLLTNHYSIQDGEKCTLKAGNSCYYSVL